MKYGIIAEGSIINDAIYRCFDLIPEAEAIKYVRMFRNLPHGENQVMHTFRELVIGAYLASHSYKVEANPKIEGKTPDWCTGKMILEVLTLHAPKELEDDIARQLEVKSAAAYWMPSNTRRLSDRIQDKAAVYSEIIGDRSYVIAVFAEIHIEVEHDEMREILLGEGKLFARNPHLSGVVLFIERGGAYRFSYFANPAASRPFPFPEGRFDTHIA